MKFTHFFIDHPIFASVVSFFITIVGVVAYFSLPVAQYPEIAPPTIQIAATYPGASAEVVSATVSTPLEQQINGVENMLYMSSQATADGKLTITVTFRLGTNLDTAQVLTQNRIATALPRLPDQVQRLGVTVKKASPDLMMVVHLYSPNDTRDQLYLSNYATLQVKDVLARVPGVGDANVIGARDYAMRVWLDPEKVAARNLTAGEVIAALQAENVQVSAGVLNQPPVATPGAFQLSIETLGRLSSPEQFGDIVIRTDPAGRITRVRDVARVELAAQDYNANGYLDTRTAVPMLIFQQPGSNALETATRVRAAIATLAKAFPEGVAYDIVYDPTQFIAQSVDAVQHTIFEAVILVVFVVILFLQTWRASIIPIVAIPISLVGTFAVLAAFGFSLNNLSLFGLVLAVGIVVDDAIVVVENVERNLRLGLSPREAAHRTMDEVSGALVAIALTLCAVFIPSAFISGISGQFFRQFAITIAASTVISAIVSLTLSPALCALLFKPHVHHPPRPAPLARPFVAFFNGFNRAFDWLADRYGRLTARLARLGAVMLVLYAGLVGLAGYQFARAPTGFITNQDLGFLLNIIQLPPGSSLARTDAVVREATRIVLDTPGIAHTVPFAGFDAATGTNGSFAGIVFAPLKPFEERAREGLTSEKITADLRRRLSVIRGAFIVTLAPPPVRGIGTAGGFKMLIQDKLGRGPAALEAATQDLVQAANKTPGLTNVFSLFNTRTPRIYADIDRTRAQILGVPANKVFEALQVYLGSSYVNDFNIFGRTYQVIAQADEPFRRDPHDIANLKTRNNAGRMVPIGSVASFRDITGPYRVPRYNLYPAAEVQGHPPGRLVRLRPRRHGTPCRRAPARRLRLRMDRTRLPAEARRQHHPADFRRLRPVRLPGARRPVRELDTPARHHPHRAHVPARRRHRPAHPRHEHRHPRPDRLRRPRRPCRQERHPDRRIRQASRGRGVDPIAGRRHRGAHPVAPHPDDVLRLHLRRHPARDRHRRGGRNAPSSRHRDVLRHDRRDHLRPAVHALVLRHGPQTRPPPSQTPRCLPRHTAHQPTR